MSREKIVSEPSITDRIQDENDQKQADTDFRSLINNNGWKRIVAYYQDVMQYQQSKLNGDIKDDEIKTIEDLKLVRFKRDSAERMTNLPEIILETMKLEVDEVEYDPHYKPEDFNDKI